MVVEDNSVGGISLVTLPIVSIIIVVSFFTLCFCVLRFAFFCCLFCVLCFLVFVFFFFFFSVF